MLWLIFVWGCHGNLILILILKLELHESSGVDPFYAR